MEEPWWWKAETASGNTADVQFLLSGDHANALLIQLYGQGYPSYIKTLGRSGHVNSRGLSEAGAAFIEAMMDKGMLVDVEHLSSRAFDSTLAIAKRRSYPLVSSHTGLRALAVPRSPKDLSVRGCANEAMRSDQQLRALKDLGSVLGIGGHVGLIKDLTYDVSTGWARAYRHAFEGIGFAAVAVGTDMNGLAAAPGPRFKVDATKPGGLAALDSLDKVPPIQYGKDQIPIIQKTLEQAALGEKRKFDFNTEGLAHYGMLPDFTLDVALSLGGRESLGAFFHSAEAFVEAWARCLPR